MTTPTEERDHWEAEAADPQRMLIAVWGDERYGVEDCLAVILDRLGTPEPNQRWLELGCGYGRLLVPLAQRYRKTRFVGVDVSRRMLSIARAARFQRRLRNAEFLDGNGRTLPKGTGSVDRAFAFVVFQHIDPEATKGYIAQVAQALKPGGRFVFQFVQGENCSPYAVDLSISEVLSWCAEAGLNATVEGGLMFEEWAWITATKP